MKKMPFIAKDLSDSLRTFLYCCAFWTVAADEELKSEEQVWLMDQFGEEGATESLSQCVGLESEEFLKAFDAAASALTDDERRRVWDLATGSTLIKMESTEGMFSDGAFDKTGRQVVGGASDNVLYVVPLG